MQVYLAHMPAAPAVGYLRGLLDAGIEITFGDTPPDPAHYTILVSGRPSEALLRASPQLRALIIPFAGVPEGTQTLLADFPALAVHNLHHNSAATAEMAITLLLSAAKRIVPADRDFRAHDWSPRHDPMPMLRLAGKTALILGYGAVGQRVARLCAALDMRVIVMKRTLPATPMPHEVYTPDALPDLLPQAQALIICLPGTPQTTGLIGARELALLPPEAVLVNVGRAAVVDGAALYEALRAGMLGAAGLDVWYSYPTTVEARAHHPPAEWPFHELDNMVMSPHRAGGVGTGEIEEARMRALAELLNAAARGAPMPNRVNREFGY